MFFFCVPDLIRRICKFLDLQDPDPSIDKQINWETLISTVLWLFNDLFSLSTGTVVNVPTVSNKQKYLSFLGIF